MDPQEIDLWGDALILKIYAITGWTVPESTVLAILTDQFRKKMLESYALVNPDEVEYAFRNYGTTVQDWGKQMNLALIDQVMIPYLTRRAELSKVEEQAMEPDPIPAPEADLSAQAMEDWCKELKGRIMRGEIGYSFMPLMPYYWLVKNGRLFRGKGERKEYWHKAIAQRQADLTVAASTGGPEDRSTLSEFMGMKEQNEFAGPVADSLLMLGRKMILFDFLKDEYE